MESSSVNEYFLISGVLAIILGVVHSTLGELLVFQHLCKSGVFSDNGATKLKERHLRSLRSTWHLVTLLGWGFGAILLVLSLPAIQDEIHKHVSQVVSITFLICAIFWLFGTKGKHPAWVVLVVISIMAWWAAHA